MTDKRHFAKSELEKLVRYFEQNVHQVKAPMFNEAQARQYLIDPLFEALGWDVRNKQMRPLHALEVIPEGRVKTSLGKVVKEQTALFPPSAAVREEMREYASMLEYIADDEYKAEQRMATKKPDYRFRIQGSTKFFVEAKKPFVDLAKNEDAIFQIKRYGFSARVPVSILTDFEEFRVFDCTRKPFYDKPKVGVLKEYDLTYKVYLDEFERLYDTFSRDAVVAGSIEALQKKYLEKRTGEFALDRAFLDDLSEWRIELAKDIAGHPKNRHILNTFTLNECVQRILDRIVFLRVCEDRAIEETGTLLALLRLWQDHPGLSLYEKFNELIKTRRSLYNGLLFTEHECERLSVSNKILENIFKNVNYPLSPYHFDEIGVEILGSIYERFLGKTIRMTQKQVRVEEKPEVRKAGGVYYTPQYIVNYIVEHTLGRLLYGERPHPSPLLKGEGTSPPLTGEGKLARHLSGGGGVIKLKLTPKQIEKLKIIDIACGSGSFLLGVFQKLIDYHVQWYTEHPKEIKEQHGVRDAYTDAQGLLRLSSRKKREILVNNIYGVDIDQQAVEVTQMSLYLKVLENENDATLNKPTMLALHEVLLPPLKNNIKCGNSLIGTDFAAQADLFDDEARRKVNPFDWEMEFPFLTPSQSPPLQGRDVPTEVGTEGVGGFDCVIGNPPYVRTENIPENLRKYFAGSENFKTAYKKFDLYVLFVERALRILRGQGLLGYILPYPFLNQSYAEPLRKMILDTSCIENILDLSDRKVFESATVESIIIVLKKEKNASIRETHEARVGRPLSENGIRNWYQIQQKNFRRATQTMFRLDVANSDLELLERVSKVSFKVGELFYVSKGIVAYSEKDGRKKEAFLHSKKSKRSFVPYLEGKDVQRYQVIFKDLYLDYQPKVMARPTFPELHENAKILVRAIAEGLMVTYDTEGYYADQKLICCVQYHRLKARRQVHPPKKAIVSPDYRDEFVVGVLNSKLLQHYYKLFLFSGLSILPEDIRNLPIRTIDFTNPAEKKTHDNLVALVDTMLDLHKQLAKASFASAKEPIQRQIAATDRKIDELVYKLYGFTEDEIKIVEGR